MVGQEWGQCNRYDSSHGNEDAAADHIDRVMDARSHSSCIHQHAQKGENDHSDPGPGEKRADNEKSGKKRMVGREAVVRRVGNEWVDVLNREGPAQEKWIDRALSSGSLGLLARVDVALRELKRLISPVAEWARITRQERIAPALRDAIACAAE